MRKHPKKIQTKIATTDNSREYRLLHGSTVSGCPICAPHRGCNRWTSRPAYRSWKNYRKSQWKI